MKSIFLFILAGLLEISGGYFVWLWLREERTAWLGILGLALLALYGVVPVFQPLEHPFGRIYAAYGAVFIVLSVVWGWQIDRQTPDFRDLLGVVICMAGVFIMMWPRAEGLHP